MNPDVADQSSSKGRWIKLAVLCGIPLLLAASFLLWYVGRQARAQAQVNLAIADLRASGLPVDNRTLTEFYQSLTDDRRTAQWLGIFGQLETFNTSERARRMPVVGLGGDVPLPGSPWSQQREVEAFLQSRQSLLADLHDAASEPMTVWFPIEFNSDETIIPHYSLSRTAARLLLLEHHAAVYAGDGQRAAQSLRSLIGLAETIRAEPILASQVTARAVQGVALGAVKRSIEHDVLDEDSLASLLEWLDFFDDYRTPFRTAIVGERAMHLPILQEPRRFDDDLFFVFGSRARDVLASLDLYERLEQLTEEEDLAV